MPASSRPPRPAHAGILAAVAAAGACGDCGSERIIRPYEYDGGSLACAPGERVFKDRCVCQSDIACPPAEVCDVVAGVCVPRADAGVPDAGARPCIAGARRCAPGSPSTRIQECRFGAWQDVSTCTSGTCFDSSTGPACTVCTPGAMRCVSGSSNVFDECKDEGTAWVRKTCPTGGTCTEVVPNLLIVCRVCTPGSTRCSPDGKALETCNTRGDGWENPGPCPYTQICRAGPPAYCQAPVCTPGTRRCSATSAQTLEECRSDGSGYNTIDCRSQPFATANAVCSPPDVDDPASTHCHDPCAVAAATKSYQGCEYWAVVMSNPISRIFKTSGGTAYPGDGRQATVDSAYGLVFANPSPTATVSGIIERRVTGTVQTVKSVSIPPSTSPSRGLLEVRLPWQEVNETGRAFFAYHVRTDGPVTVYQFNPLVAGPQQDGNCFFGVCLSGNPYGQCDAQNRCMVYTFSNDASLLLPAHILGTGHVVVAQTHEWTSGNPNGTGQSVDYAGQLAIVGTQAATRVTVKLSGWTAAAPGASPSPPLAAEPQQGTAGQTLTFNLGPYEVLQFHSARSGGTRTCVPNGIPSYTCTDGSDMTGTIVTSDKPIAVFGGAHCTFKPADKPFCDHIEEQMFPFNTWGKKYVAVKSAPYEGTSSPSPDYYRVVSGCGPSSCPNGTTVTLTPVPAASDVVGANPCAGGSLNPCRLPPGAWFEFKSPGQFAVDADFPVVLAQYFTGQWANPGSRVGDPSLVIFPPQEQWRNTYTVLAPPSIRLNYASFTATSAAPGLTIDGAAQPNFAPIAGTAYYFLRVAITQGAHALRANEAVGVTVHGYDSFVSYGYTGGLDLKQVNSINPGG